MILVVWEVITLLLIVFEYVTFFGWNWNMQVTTATNIPGIAGLGWKDILDASKANETTVFIVLKLAQVFLFQLIKVAFGIRAWVVGFEAPISELLLRLCDLQLLLADDVRCHRLLRSGVLGIGARVYMSVCVLDPFHECAVYTGG